MLGYSAPEKNGVTKQYYNFQDIFSSTCILDLIDILYFNSIQLNNLWTATNQFTVPNNTILFYSVLEENGVKNTCYFNTSHEPS